MLSTFRLKSDVFEPQTYYTIDSQSLCRPFGPAKSQAAKFGDAVMLD
jgi:hypothetical protein